jgi:UDP:flavonoid glycosyltransferase YjiC (YdhE family)
MATIVFLLYPEVGHLNPSFKLARKLQARSHHIYYLGLPDFGEIVRAQGLEFIPIFEQLFPLGFIREWAEKNGVSALDAAMLQAHRLNNPTGFNPFQEIEATLRNIAPRLLIVDALLPNIAQALLRFGVDVILSNIILYTPWLSRQESYQSLRRLPELMFCPKEFDFPQAETSAQRFYIEASIDLDRKEIPFDWSRIDPDKSLLYACLGSQNHLYRQSGRFYSSMIDCMRDRPDLQAILVIGAQQNSADFNSIPPNVLLINQAPQIEILKKASIVLTHGGLGTIKESIFFGAPMIVLPVMREQPMNAARVTHHGLGLRADINAVTPRQISTLVERIEGSQLIRQNLRRMQAIFHEAEASEKGVEIIERFLSSPAPQSRSTNLASDSMNPPASNDRLAAPWADTGLNLGGDRVAEHLPFKRRPEKRL